MARTTPSPDRGRSATVMNAEGIGATSISQLCNRPDETMTSIDLGARLGSANRRPDRARAGDGFFRTDFLHVVGWSTPSVTSTPPQPSSPATACIPLLPLRQSCELCFATPRPLSKENTR